MEFTNDDPKVRFTVPDRPTVRQQMRYADVAVMQGNNFTAWWRAASVLIEDWECDLIPALDKANELMDKETNPKITEILTWVGMKVKEHINALEEIPKN